MWAAEVITSKNILLCDNNHFEGAEVIDKGTKITITKGGNKNMQCGLILEFLIYTKDT